jgi:hypothetical protein
MNLDEIFSLFDNNNDGSVSPSKSFISKENPYFCLKMFKDYILKFDDLKRNFIPFLSSIHPEMSQKFSESSLNPEYYYKAFNYLKKINLAEKEHYEIFCEYIDLNFIKACNRSINYFVEVEEYEKCSLINIYRTEGIKLLKLNLSDLED